MSLQDATPDTLNYMILGFAVILGAIGVHIRSLSLRFRNVRRDLAALGEIESSARASSSRGA